MTTTTENRIERFRGLGQLPPALRAGLVAGSRIVEVPGGSKVFAPGRSADNLLLLLDGTVRVQQRSDTGPAVFRYRVRAGESCVRTTACMLAFEDCSANGVAETDVRAVAIPRATCDSLADA
ncbi:cyclic nucleotide-binding domain-containing protein [Rhodobacteraceae bacterium 2CG4]|uniref:Cyclic nucleotide-binding domain-containing protein n=1 Tax=Halovulum marinum TaxID=2662447 RepID=A0A6L5YZ52_9RHOB|nr:cyclic nucleotide-binding domain-containing protein [Halovulum marinum]MSU89498.1 cyclic nucleotide-binding domain-containing protein [Halovulum marinum]